MFIRYIVFFLLGVLVLAPLVAIHAESNELLVTSTVTLQKQDRPYFLNGISVESGGELTIQPGVEIFLTGGSSVTIHGQLLANGTPEDHIVITSFSPANPWKQFQVYPGSLGSSITYSDLSYFTDPVLVQSSNTVMSNDSFTDGIENFVVISSPGQPVSPQIRNLTFRNILLGNNMGNEGVLFQGNFQDIFLDHLSFTDSRMTSTTHLLGMRVEGSYSTVRVDNSLFGGICTGHFEGLDPGKSLNFVLNPEHCTWKKIPTVFVPGYGTSINLKKLAVAEDRNPDLNGWHFLRALTPAYFVFLNDLEKNNVHYDVAYYDWRLSVNDIVQSYLIPAIEQAKQETGSSQVYLVAHSYGGIVARQYIQGSQYKGDVASLVEVGTPNLGAAKAYSVWEGGVLPPDWGALNNLILLYEYESLFEPVSGVTLIHKYFPSAQDLLPIYPVLYYQNQLVNSNLLLYQNPTLIGLEDTVSLLHQRTSVTQFFSTSEYTQEFINTDTPPGQIAEWPDGRPSISQPPLVKVGDGTVPVSSAALPGFTHYEISGEHSLLLQEASSQILTLLYHIPVAQHDPNVPSQSFHWFVFDCPVAVTVTLPDGTQRSSQELNSPVVPSEVETSDQTIWMFLPEQLGRYQISIQALADTEVRFWVDNGSITTHQLHKDQIWNSEYPPRPQALSNLSLPPVISSPVPAQDVMHSETIISPTQTTIQLTQSLSFPIITWNSPLAYARVDSELARPKPKEKRPTISNGKTSSKSKVVYLVLTVTAALSLIILLKKQQE